MTPVKPLGHYVLVEIIPVQFQTASGIIINTADEQKREEKGRDIAKIIAFGPTAYKGFEGCDSPEGWGVKVGDTIELKSRYDGKSSRASEYDKKYSSLRYVLDNAIIGVFSDELTNLLVQGGEK